MLGVYLRVMWRIGVVMSEMCCCAGSCFRAVLVDVHSFPFADTQLQKMPERKTDKTYVLDRNKHTLVALMLMKLANIN